MLLSWYSQGGQVCVLKTATRVRGFSEKFYGFVCCEGDASMCFNEGGDKGSRF